MDEFQNMNQQQQMNTYWQQEQMRQMQEQQRLDNQAMNQTPYGYQGQLPNQGSQSPQDMAWRQRMEDDSEAPTGILFSNAVFPQQTQSVEPPMKRPPTKPPKKSHKALIITLICLVVAAGLGVGAYFLFFRKTETEDLAEAEKVAMKYYTAWAEYDEEGMKECFDGSVTITDHTQEDEYMETGYWITYGKDANIHAWADYSEPNEGLSGDHTVYCTIEADITGQGDPARSPDTGKVKSETFAMIQKNGKWYIAKNVQPKMEEIWTYGVSTEDNTEASTLAPDITPEDTDLESAKYIQSAVSIMMADEELFTAVYDSVRDGGTSTLFLACEGGYPFGESKSHLKTDYRVAEEVNKNLGGKSPAVYGTYEGIMPTGWGVSYDPRTSKIYVYAITGNLIDGYKGVELAPDSKSTWEPLNAGVTQGEEGTTEETTTSASTGSTSSNGKWINFDDMHFFINGKKFTLGESTLQDLINGGVPLDDRDASKYENIIPKNTESSGYRIVLGEYWTAQLFVINNTEEDKKASECVISGFYYTEKQDGTQDVISFDFPLTVTPEELKATLGEPDDTYHYDGGADYQSDRYTWQQESTQYIGYKKYNFEFVNGKLNEISITFK